MEFASAALGVKVAVFVPELNDTDPLTSALVAVFLSLMLVPLIVPADIASLNVTLTFVVIATFVAPPVGTVPDTVGAVVSGATPVENPLVTGPASELPARSFAPVVTVTV